MIQNSFQRRLGTAMCSWSQALCRDAPRLWSSSGGRWCFAMLMLAFGCSAFICGGMLPWNVGRMPTRPRLRARASITCSVHHPPACMFVCTDMSDNRQVPYHVRTCMLVCTCMADNRQVPHHTEGVVNTDTGIRHVLSTATNSAQIRLDVTIWVSIPSRSW